MSKIIAPAHSRREIEQFAMHIKQNLGLQNILYIPILEIAENTLVQIDETYSFEVVENNDLNFSYNEYAKYCPESNTLMIKNDVYIAAYNGDGRQRFTVAHELGHYFMHRNLIGFSRVSDKIEIPRYMDPEWQADVFSGAFLINPNCIKKMSTQEISQSCGVSHQAATIAIKQLTKAKRA